MVLKTLEYEWYISIKAYKFTVCEILKYFLHVHAIQRIECTDAMVLQSYLSITPWELCGRARPGGSLNHGAHTLIRMCSNLIMNTCLMIT